MPNNPIGISLGQAVAIPSSTTFRDKVSSKNPSDVFSFNLTNPGVLSLRFKSLGRSASLNLIQDRNQNGLVEAGEVFQTLSSKSKRVGKLDLADLALGTYYLQVAGSGSPYQLKLSAATADSADPKSVQSFVGQVVKLTNQFRAQKGLAPLTLNSKLSQAAQTHSQNMATQDFFGHLGKDGSSASDRASKAGYNWRTLAENIAAGQRTPSEVVNSWIKSPGHRENILNATVKEIGVGYFFLGADTGTTNYSTYWTQNFGKS
ncbi:MAG: CAP domain-containing protein [Leptolyngbyaceae cyanobacterium CSU_1_4]|nr:CAP domain-containing protein [Leptolyngbyaceae cyanobacterium CSU_1_4]